MMRIFILLLMLFLLVIGRTAHADYNCLGNYGTEGTAKDSDRILGKAFFIGLVRIDKAEAKKEITKESGKKYLADAVIITPIVSYIGEIKPETTVLHFTGCHIPDLKDGQIREIYLEPPWGDLLFLGHPDEVMDYRTWRRLRQRNGFYDWFEDYKVRCIKQNKEPVAPYAGVIECKDKTENR